MLTMSIVNERLAMAFAARRSMVKIRYIGDSGMNSRMIARTSGSSWSARVDFRTYAGDGDTPGKYTIGSGDLRRRSSTRTSSTTPMTVYHLSVGSRRRAGPACRVGSSPGNNDVSGRLADDHVGYAPFFLDPLEVAATQEFDPHRLEVRAAGAREANERRLRATGQDLGSGDVLGARALVQGERGDEPDGFDARQRLQTIHERVLKLRDGHPVVQLGAVGRDLECEDVLGVVPGIDVAELPEAAHEQRRSNQQDEGGRGLHDHQRVARETPAADDASSGLLEAAQPRAREAEGGQHAERARRQHRDARREEQRREVQAARWRVREWVRRQTRRRPHPAPRGPEAGRRPTR